MMLGNLLALYITSLTALTGSFKVTKYVGFTSSVTPNQIIADYGYTIEDFIDSREYTVSSGDTFFVTPTDYTPDYYNTSIHSYDTVALPTLSTVGQVHTHTAKYDFRYADQIVPHLNLTNWGSWDYDTRLFQCEISKNDRSDAINFRFYVYNQPYTNVIIDLSATVIFHYPSGTPSQVCRTLSWSFPLFALTSNDYINSPEYLDYYYFSDYSNGADGIQLFVDFSYRVAYMQELDTNLEQVFEEDLVDAFNNGYEDGYTQGYGEGYNYGWSLGTSSGNSFRNLFGTLIDTPIIYLRKMFDYELFGISVFKALATVISLIVALSVFRLVRGIF